MHLNNTASFIILVLAFFFGATQIAVAQDKQPALKFNADLEKEFIAGANGDEAALARAIQTADKILAANPKDAQTLVWRGAVGLPQAGKAFGSGNFSEGGELWQAALENMKSAVEIEPNSVSIRTTRAAALLSGAKHFPSPDVAKNLRETAVEDYEKVLAIYGEKFKMLSEKQRQQIFFALADTYDKLADKTKARNFYQRLLDETSETGKMRETAIEWLKKNN
jgi:tetratricopeptide (TPR) repeat protein